MFRGFGDLDAQWGLLWGDATERRTTKMSPCMNRSFSYSGRRCPARMENAFSHGEMVFCCFTEIYMTTKDLRDSGWPGMHAVAHASKMQPPLREPKCLLLMQVSFHACDRHFSLCNIFVLFLYGS